MANYHALTTNKKGKTTVIFHFNVPVFTLTGGSELRDAIASEFTETNVPDLTTENPTEYAKLQSGETWEYSTNLDFTGLSIGEVKTMCDDYYTDAPISLVTYVKTRYKYWKYTGA